MRIASLVGFFFANPSCIYECIMIFQVGPTYDKCTYIIVYKFYNNTGVKNEAKLKLNLAWFKHS